MGGVASCVARPLDDDDAGDATRVQSLSAGAVGESPQASMTAALVDTQQQTQQQPQPATLSAMPTKQRSSVSVSSRDSSITASRIAFRERGESVAHTQAALVAAASSSSSSSSVSSADSGVIILPRFHEARLTETRLPDVQPTFHAAVSSPTQAMRSLDSSSGASSGTSANGSGTGSGHGRRTLSVTPLTSSPDIALLPTPSPAPSPSAAGGSLISQHLRHRSQLVPSSRNPSPSHVTAIAAAAASTAGSNSSTPQHARTRSGGSAFGFDVAPRPQRALAHSASSTNMAALAVLSAVGASSLRASNSGNNSSEATRGHSTPSHLRSNSQQQAASAPSHTRRLVALPHTSQHNHSKMDAQEFAPSFGTRTSSSSSSSSQSGKVVREETVEKPLVYAHVGASPPVILPAATSSNQGSRASSDSVSQPSGPAPVAMNAPVLAHAQVTAEQRRSLNECLAAPKLMSADEYRAQYPSYDAHNADYMLYRQRWEVAEREARESAAGVPGSRARASSRSLLCTPTHGSVQSSPVASPLLSPYRTLSPSGAGAFGYRDAPTTPLQQDRSLTPAGVDPLAPLYLPPPVFHEDVPDGFVHRHSVMAFMMESSRPASLRATPLQGFLARDDAGAGDTSSAQSSPMPSPLSLRRRGALAPPTTYGEDGSEMVLPRTPRTPDVGYSPLTSFRPRVMTNLLQQYGAGGASAGGSPRDSSSSSTAGAFVPVLPSTHNASSSPDQEPQGSSTPGSSTDGGDDAGSRRLPVLGGIGAHFADSHSQQQLAQAGAVAVGRAHLLSRSQMSSRATTSQAAGGGGGSTTHSHSPSEDKFQRSLSDGHQTPPPLQQSQSQAPSSTSASAQTPHRRLKSSRVNEHLLRSSAAATSSAAASAAEAYSPATLARELARGPSSRSTASSGAAALVTGDSPSPTAEPTFHSEEDSAEPSLPGTPGEPDDELSRPPSAAVLRSQAHLGMITNGWQERVEGASFPAIAQAASSTNTSSPTASMRTLAVSDARLSAAASSVAKKLTIPPAARLRAVKHAAAAGGSGSMPSAVESSPGSGSLPPAHSPGGGVGGLSNSSGMNKRRLRMSGSTTVDSADAPFAHGSPLQSSGSTNASPLQLQRRRLLVQLAASNVQAAQAASVVSPTATAAGGAVASTHSGTPTTASCSFPPVGTRA